MNNENIQTEELLEIQQIETELLKKIHDICEKYNITYFLVAGTLLGAVRHGGFIPWDEDMDIGMFREDYEKFMKIAPDVFSGDYAVMDSSVNSGYSRIYGKVFKLGTKYYEAEWDEFVENSGLWIDIFPIDKVDAPNVEEAVRIARKRRDIREKELLIRRYRNGVDRDKFSRVTKVVCGLLKPVSYKNIVKYVKNKLTADEGKTAKFCTNYGSGYGVVKQTMPIDYYLPVKKIKFGECEFNCPNNTEKYLTQIYKDYMKLPPEDKRVMKHDLLIRE